MTSPRICCANMSTPQLRARRRGGITDIEIALIGLTHVHTKTSPIIRSADMRANDDVMLMQNSRKIDDGIVNRAGIKK